MSNVDIAYSDTDFFYNRPDVCSDTNTPDTDCYINKTKANNLMNIARTHGVANERLYNMQKKYNDTILCTVNLGIGILVTGAYVLYKITKLK
jgi:hypothetical protein